MNWSDWFYYDETSPSCLRWKVGRDANGKVLVNVGDTAGTIGGQLYYRVQLNHKVYTVHRIIWEIYHGMIPDGMEIDHKDKFKTNNNIANLRQVTKQVNCRNRSLRSDSTSMINAVNRRVQLLPSGNSCASWIGRYCGIGGR